MCEEDFHGFNGSGPFLQQTDQQTGGKHDLTARWGGLFFTLDVIGSAVFFQTSSTTG